jgi:choline dehydrogenase-like flavoprotein
MTWDYYLLCTPTNLSCRSDQDEDYIVIPGLAGGAIGTKYDWNLTYLPNPDAAGRAPSIPQGKAVGGSSLLNRMVFDRGSSADYDRWRALGNRGWGWKDLLPYFKKVQNSHSCVRSGKVC